ncbi:MAG TPA: ferredoxin--NADP reductase [Planctomycetota bacterium]|nr:ferredoxin--NADP reductase [Planctomycetota bacterium]
MPDAAEHTPLNARVTAREDLNDALVLLEVEYADGRTIEFEPGQFANLGLPPRDPAQATGRSGLVKRAYSIASAPGRRTLEFFVRLVENGALTPLLWELRPGDPLWMDERILGKFTLQNAPVPPAPAERDLVMISTGTGIAPFQSMLRHFRGRGLWRRFVTINGVRIQSDLGYRGELERTAAEDPSVVYVPICSRDDARAGWPGLCGRVDAALEPRAYERLVGAPLAPERCQVFLCGNPDMIDTVQKLLETRGFRKHTRKEPGQVHFERYW